jgi:hypothetical protein
MKIEIDEEDAWKEKMHYKTSDCCAACNFGKSQGWESMAFRCEKYEKPVDGYATCDSFEGG